MNAILKPPQYFIQGIPAQFVEHFWPFAEPYIKRALDHTSGELHAMDIKRSCINRDMQLWLVSQEKRIFGAITTELVVYPHRKHCRVITLAGKDFNGWLEIADSTLLAWGKEQGCDALESIVRIGLAQRMKPFGYKHKHSVLLKEII